MTTEERQAYWAAIDEKLKELGAPPRGVPELPKDCVMLTSVEKRFAGLKGGVTMEVGKRAAAKAIVEGTHRLATEAEIEAYRYQQEDAREKIEAEENKRLRRAVYDPVIQSPKGKK